MEEEEGVLREWVTLTKEAASRDLACFFIGGAQDFPWEETGVEEMLRRWDMKVYLYDKCVYGDWAKGTTAVATTGAEAMPGV